MLHQPAPPEWPRRAQPLPTCSEPEAKVPGHRLLFQVTETWGPLSPQSIPICSLDKAWLGRHWVPFSLFKVPKLSASESKEIPHYL